jgi:hypothetical protein
VRAIQLTPDGKSLLVGSSPKILKVFDAANRTELAALWNDAAVPKAVAANERPAPPPNAAMEDLPIAVPNKTASRGWLLAGLVLGLGLGVLILAALGVKYFTSRRSV